MAQKIDLEVLVGELKSGSGYHHNLSTTRGYFDEESVKLLFGADSVYACIRHSYDGEQDMSSEYYTYEWSFSVPVSSMEASLKELAETGQATLRDVCVHDSYYGREAYQPNISFCREYVADVTMNLNPDKKPIVALSTPKTLYGLQSEAME